MLHVTQIAYMFIKHPNGVYFRYEAESNSNDSQKHYTCYSSQMIHKVTLALCRKAGGCFPPTRAFSALIIAPLGLTN